MTYTIREIAKLAGVTTRTIRYYDQIGLLPPAYTGDNGYRYYDEESLLLLQQIMFFRELDVPLKEIHMIMSRPDFSLLDALQSHRASLEARANRLLALLDTVERTITSITGEETMTDKDYFEGFDESQYEDEARERWGDTPQYKESQRNWSSYSKAKKEEIKQEGGRITVSMVGTPTSKPGDADIQAAVGDYYRYLTTYFYQCDIVLLRNLAEMWVADPRFAISYDRIREGGAVFVRDAVRIYCDNHG